MRFFLVGSASLMLISSLPVDATVEYQRGPESRIEPQQVRSIGEPDESLRHEARLVPQKVRLMQTFGETLPPIGHVDLCKRIPQECEVATVALVSTLSPIALSSERWMELTYVNTYVNEAIEPVTDLELYGVIEWWDYPTDNKGDCEDYVLLKRRILIERGWPESALLITVVRDENNEGHAVLTVRTDDGDFVLDNKHNEIRLWGETGYGFVKRQSEYDPALWLSLTPPDQAPAPGISASNREH
jgi:predicted transglutaminase-like cysteine proteinase